MGLICLSGCNMAKEGLLSTELQRLADNFSDLLDKFENEGKTDPYF